MDKSKLHRHWRRFRDISPWYFLAAFLVFSAVCILALRHNNLRMAELRQAVYTADEKGEGVEQALQDLRAFVGAHMNTELSSGNNAVYPPIQLKYTYQRLVSGAGDHAKENNESLYAVAQDYCEKSIPNGFSGRVRLDCIQNYVSQHSTPTTNIPDGLYKFDFASPRWSPDLAGLSMVLALLTLILFVVSLLDRGLSRPDPSG